MPHKTWSIGEQVIQTDFQPNVADQVVAVFANSASRASGWPAPPVGAMSYLQDTPGALWTYYGGSWHSPIPLGLVAYLDNGTDTNIGPNASIDLPGMLWTGTPPAGRRYRFTLSVQFGVTMNFPTCSVTAAITDGANAVLKDRQEQVFSSTVQNMATTSAVSLVVTTTGAAMTVKGRAANQTPGANGTYAQDQVLIIEDLGGT